MKPLRFNPVLLIYLLPLYANKTSQVGKYCRIPAAGTSCLGFANPNLSIPLLSGSQPALLFQESWHFLVEFHTWKDSILL